MQYRPSYGWSGALVGLCVWVRIWQLVLPIFLILQLGAGQKHKAGIYMHAMHEPEQWRPNSRANPEHGALLLNPDQGVLWDYTDRMATYALLVL